MFNRFIVSLCSVALIVLACGPATDVDSVAPVSAAGASPIGGMYEVSGTTVDIASGVKRKISGKQVGRKRLPGGEPVVLARNLLVGEDEKLGPHEQLTGHVDDLLVLGRALTAEEVKTLSEKGAESCTQQLIGPQINADVTIDDTGVTVTNNDTFAWSNVDVVIAAGDPPEMSRFALNPVVAGLPSSAAPIFSASPEITLGGAVELTASVSLFDVDGDGDLDALLAPGSPRCLPAADRTLGPG